MKVIEPSYEILDRRELKDYQKIEHCARTAYKSEDKITDTSAKEMVNKLIKLKHYPTLEFFNLHYFIEILNPENDASIEAFQGNNYRFIMQIFHYHKYVAISYVEEGERIGVIISGTYRAMVEAIMKTNVPEDSNAYPLFSGLIIKEMSEDSGIPLQVPEFNVITEGEVSEAEYFKCTRIQADELCSLITNKQEQEFHLMCAVKFIVNRAVTHELVRHRPCSFIQESQRYCRYSEEKFGREVTFILPSAFPIFTSAVMDMDDPNEPCNIWIESLRVAESSYMKLLDLGASPQAARTVLPNSCKTEIVIYTTIQEWRHIFKLRTAESAEPSMRQVMIPLAEEFDNHKHLWE